MSFNSLPNDEILALSKLKVFADNNLHRVQLMEFLFNRIENIMGKGENAGNQHFLLFPICFQNASSLRLLKVGIVW